MNAPVEKRIYLTGLCTNYTVLIKDNDGARVVFEIPAPSGRAGHAIVRALRECDRKFGSILPKTDRRLT